MQLYKHDTNGNTLSLATWLWSAGPAAEAQETARDTVEKRPAAEEDKPIHLGLLLWVSTFHQNQSQDQYPWI